VTTRFAASENPYEVHDLHAGGPVGRAKIMNHVLKILWESELEQAGDYVTIQVAQLTKSGADVWLSEDYIPPSLNLFDSGSLLKLLSSYATINSFTKLNIKETLRGETYKWPMRLGSRYLA
jgi:type VI protein secretion system component VasA